MKARLRYVQDLIKNSYWFLPALITLAAIVLSVVTQAFDSRNRIETLEPEWLRSLLFAGGADGAREVLSTIAGSMITVAGVVFSITIVALTLASSQFGPRVLTSFMRDRGNKLVLGIFIATFVYSLLVLRNIRSGDDTSSAAVPHLSVTVALLLALASLSVLIYFIHHVATEIQAPNLIVAIAGELHHDIAGLIPDEADPPPPDEDRTSSELLPARFEEEAGSVLARNTGYFDAVDAQALVDVAEEHGLVMRLEYRPGHFIVEGNVLATVWPGGAVDDRVAHHVTGACVIGPRRTAIQDVEFPVNQLVEIAVRALSPGINDPFTAITCIDHLSAGLCNLAPRPFPAACWFGADGALRLVVARPITFAGVVRSAFEQIRQNAGAHAAIHIRLLEGAGRAIECVSRPSRMEPLLSEAGLVLEAAEAGVRAEADLKNVRDRYQAVQAAADSRRSELSREQG